MTANDTAIGILLMTDVEYVMTSLVWAVYGLALGFGLGYIARLMWISHDRK